MTDYGGFTREQLLERLRELEAKIAFDELQTIDRNTERRRDQASELG